MYGLFLGSVERKFPRDTYPNAKQQAKVAANKAGLNERQRLQATGKYSESTKAKKKQNRLAKKNGTPKK